MPEKTSLPFVARCARELASLGHIRRQLLVGQAQHLTCGLYLTSWCADRRLAISQGADRLWPLVSIRLTIRSV
jgi:hypothetical protein